MRNSLLLFFKLSLVGFALLICVVVYEFSRNQSDFFISRLGSLKNAEDSVSRGSGKNESIFLNADLTSTSGLQVRLRVQLPQTASTAKVPLVLLLGGYETGRYAVDLVREIDGIAFAAIDYPFSGNVAFRTISEKISLIRRMQTAFLDTPPALMLAVDWLERQSWFDPERVHLVGVSLGVPFAAAAGAADNRFKKIWLIHGSGNNVDWIKHEMTAAIESQWLRSVFSHMVVFMLYGRTFDTQIHIVNMAPNLVVLISAENDERVPLKSRKEWYQLAQQYSHVTSFSTAGRHIGPRRSKELNRLLEIVIKGVYDRTS